MMAHMIVKAAIRRTGKTMSLRFLGMREFQTIGMGITIRPKSEEMLKTICTIE